MFKLIVIYYLKLLCTAVLLSYRVNNIIYVVNVADLRGALANDGTELNKYNLIIFDICRFPQPLPLQGLSHIMEYYCKQKTLL